MFGKINYVGKAYREEVPNLNGSRKFHKPNRNTGMGTSKEI